MSKQSKKLEKMAKKPVINADFEPPPESDLEDEMSVVSTTSSSSSGTISLSGKQ
jgi:hypothetical protein